MVTERRNTFLRFLNSWNEMKKISECMSPLSWIFCAFATFFPLILLLRPTFKEFFAFLLADQGAFFIYMGLEKKIYLSLYPDTALYFEGIDPSQLRAMSLAEQLALLDSFFLFPKRRAIFCFIFSILKVSPSLLVMLFYWHHSGSFVAHALMIGGIELLVFCFFSSAVFTESHFFISRLIEKLHQQVDLTQAFAGLSTHYSKKDFAFQELLSFAFIIFFMTTLQWFVITSGNFSNNNNLAINLCSVGFVSLLLLARLWYLNRRYFIGGLERLFEHMELLNYRNDLITLPIHSTPLLARFENSFNLLTKRLRTSEQELSSLIFLETDKSRYRAIGEMSALIAHDLSGPLHVAQFCVTQMQERPERVLENSKYLSQLATNIEQAVGLTTSLRARIKNPKNSHSKSSFFEAHNHVLRLLETQYSVQDFKNIQISYKDGLVPVDLAISRIDLIHILDNIYRNAIENILQNAVVNPFLSIAIPQISFDRIDILIQDNGTGLSPENFENLTAFQYLRNAKTLSKSGLGLRLTRRLIELNKGSLTILPPSDSTRGTTFNLSLKIHPDSYLIFKKEGLRAD
jgi:signal transduction histidine kinase